MKMMAKKLLPILNRSRRQRAMIRVVKGISSKATRFILRSCGHIARLQLMTTWISEAFYLVSMVDPNKLYVAWTWLERQATPAKLKEVKTTSYKLISKHSHWCIRYVIGTLPRSIPNNVIMTRSRWTPQCERHRYRVLNHVGSASLTIIRPPITKIHQHYKPH